MASSFLSCFLYAVIGEIFTPMLTHAPLQSMLLVSALAGLVTQSNAASVAITIPFLQAALALGTATPLSLAVMAAGGSAMLQYYLTGGPVAALATVIPVTTEAAFLTMTPLAINPLTIFFRNQSS